MSAVLGSNPWSYGNLPGSEILHPFTDIQNLYVLRRPLDMKVQSSIRACRLIASLYHQRGSLKRLGLPTNIYEIPSHPDAAGMADLFDHYQMTDSDALLVFGGDGISSNTNSAALDAGFAGPIVHYGVGNARDQFHMLFDGHSRKDPAQAMLHSRLAKLHLLKIMSDKPNKSGKQTVAASGYWSAGDLIYDITERVGSDEFRTKTATMGEKRKLAAEMRVMLGKIGTGQQITLEDNDGSRDISDVVITNGERMAKKVRFGGLRYVTPGFGQFEINHSTKRSVIASLGRASMGHFPHLNPEDVYEFRITTRDRDSVKVQRDGELDEYPSGTTFTIGLHDTALSVATTRLAA